MKYRVIGFDGRHLGHEDEKEMWVICESIPVCVAIEEVRTCTPDEILAWQYMHGRRMHTDYEPGPPHLQQAYVNEEPSRASRRKEASGAPTASVTPTVKKRGRP